ncbi:DUF4157 domain-containing protein [Actinoplanes sp. NPDC051861]|uniref:eCIS core domain-containing protein n=1 Tax=Actinoplanes sp. NPDC051861 TaxID=3155170 RepID=UPI003419B964
MSDFAVAGRPEKAPRGTVPPSRRPPSPGGRGSVPEAVADLHGSIGNQAVGDLLDPAVRASAEAGLGHDFSGVRVHTGPAAASAAERAGARAFTVGDDIVLNAGAPSPRTPAGQRLLAHELAHVVQQRAGTPAAGRAEAGPEAEREAHDAAAAVTRGHPYAVKARTGVTLARQPKSLDDELDEELRKRAAANPRVLDPNHPDYANTLQQYGFELTHDSSMALLPEPAKAKDRAAWKRRFQKSELLAGRILSQGGPRVTQKEERGQMLASDLATAGFVDEAMALARQVTNRDLRVFVYNEALDRPDRIRAAQVAEITKFHVSRHAAPADNPVLSKLHDGAYAKNLGPEKVNAGLIELVKGYEKDPGLPQELARVLFFHPESRAGFTTWMLKDGKGALLRKVSEQPFFVEGAKITTPSGVVSPSESTRAWAIANKQKVAVADVIALTTAAQTPVKQPKAFDAKSLKAWLESNTEIIGQAIRKQHPGDPAAAEALLHQITSAFMYHVDPDGPDIEPDKAGKISHLAAGGPQKTQLQVDCDVLATYSVRLLVSSGFTPVGYMAVEPTDKNRAAHAMALLRSGTEWRAISNMSSRTFPATATKDQALTMLRDFGIGEAYDAARPLTGYKIYYQDSDAKGTLPDGVRNNDAAAEMTKLGK